MPTNIWTIQSARNWTQDYLARAGDEHARLSAEWLLGAACGLSRIEVYTHFDQPLSVTERIHLREAIKRRAAGEPLQYITGEVGFRYLSLKVRPGVLIPRPETEVLVDLALEILPPQPENDELLIADLCTGSGCIGLALAHERPDVCVVASDLAPEAVALAKDNAEVLGLAERYTVFEGDLFAPLTPQKFDLLVANPPYIPTAYLDSVSSHPRTKHEASLSLRDSAGQARHKASTFTSGALPREVADFEPRLALDGGDDGLDLARRILRDARYRLRDGCGLIMELDVRNATQAAHFAVELEGYARVDVRPDLTGRERFLVAITDTSPMGEGSVSGSAGDSDDDKLGE